VGHNFICGIALIDGGLKDLHALAREFRAAQAANKFFALPREHRAHDYLDPTHVAFDDVHAG
jgi:hypothetical protein